MKFALLVATLLIGVGIWALSSSIGNHEDLTLFGNTIDSRYLQVMGLFCAIGGILTILSAVRGLQPKSS